MSSDNSRLSFDLVSQPWLLARTLDGGRIELSLTEVFRRSPELAGLTGEVPTQVFALTRLLLAVLHSTLRGPRDVDEWAELWEADELPAAEIERYLGRHRDHFDLFHPETPFFQVAGLHTEKGDVSELSKLIADVPNNERFFSTRMARDLSVSFPEAARWLVHCHAFDPSGIKSGAADDPRTSGGRGYPIGTGWCGYLGGVLLEGDTLRETLLLNLVARPTEFVRADPDTDLPAWERDPEKPWEHEYERPGENRTVGRAPTGPVDLFTWQSRRIRLVPEGDSVTGVLICNGERSEAQNRHNVEPHSAWRRSQNQEKVRGGTVYMPRGHDPEKAIWRGLASLLARRSSTQSEEAAHLLCPEVVQWLGEVTEGLVERDRPVRLRAIGMTYGTQSATTEEIVDDVLRLHAVLAGRDAEDLVATAESCVEDAENVARALGTFAANLVAAAGGDGSGPRVRALEAAYGALDTPFRTWLARCTVESDPTDARQEWHRTAHRIAGELARELVREASPAASRGRKVGGRLINTFLAHRWFAAALRKALPYAYTEGPERQAA